MQDIIKANYTLCVAEGLLNFRVIVEKLEASGIKHLVGYDDKKKFTETDEGNNAILAFRLPISYRKKLEFTRDDIGYPVKYINEDLILMFRGITLERNNIFFKPLRFGIKRLFEAGVTNMFAGKNFIRGL